MSSKHIFFSKKKKQRVVIEPYHSFSTFFVLQCLYGGAMKIYEFYIFRCKHFEWRPQKCRTKATVAKWECGVLISTKRKKNEMKSMIPHRFSIHINEQFSNFSKKKIKKNTQFLQRCCDIINRVFILLKKKKFFCFWSVFVYRLPFVSKKMRWNVMNMKLCIFWQIDTKFFFFEKRGSSKSKYNTIYRYFGYVHMYWYITTYWNSMDYDWHWLWLTIHVSFLINMRLTHTPIQSYKKFK